MSKKEGLDAKVIIIGLYLQMTKPKIYKNKNSVSYDESFS
jgi:hypothetical protein